MELKLFVLVKVQYNKKFVAMHPLPSSGMCLYFSKLYSVSKKVCAVVEADKLFQNWMSKLVGPLL